jgi:hypothetical protein
MVLSRPHGKFTWKYLIILKIIITINAVIIINILPTTSTFPVGLCALIYALCSLGITGILIPRGSVCVCVVLGMQHGALHMLHPQSLVIGDRVLLYKLDWPQILNSPPHLVPDSSNIVF